jgi:hypothetical protein
MWLPTLCLLSHLRKERVKINPKFVALLWLLSMTMTAAIALHHPLAVEVVAAVSALFVLIGIWY